jgi:hypothetical protein
MSANRYIYINFGFITKVVCWGKNRGSYVKFEDFETHFRLIH